MYHKLEDGHFRLLSFNNLAGTDCQLNSYEINRAPRYIALSYVWGDATSQETCRISVNGEQIQVRQNLYDALRHLAIPILRRRCLLWVDAVCINQTDVEERNAQVRKMKAIFEKAKHIYAWLGLPRDGDETRLAIQLMWELDLYYRDARAKHDDDMAAIAANIRTKLVFWPGPGSGDIETRKAWQGISNIFSRPYWKRTWIYQEVTTPTDIQFWCGRYNFNHWCFTAAVRFTFAFLEIPGFNNRSMRVTGAIHANQAHAARLSRCANTTRRLIDLLFEIRPTLCTDPRDKVYALLGHAADVAPDQLSIDYDKSPVDVYVDVVKLYVFHKENPTLDFLGHTFVPPDDMAQQGWSDPSVPSWVPDWRPPTKIPPIYKGPSRDGVASYPFDPCPGTTIEAYIRNAMLELRGVVMDNLRIEILTDMWSADLDYTDLSTPRRWYDDFIGNGDVTWDEPIRRALVGSRTEFLDDQNVGHVEVSQMVDWDLVDMEEAQLDRLEYGTKRSAMIRDINRICRCRRMAMLSDGSIAIVPGGSRSGDRITLFHGGKALYVLRPIPERRNTFRFIGECYVDGLMDGALMELNARRGRTASLVRMV